MSGRVALHSCSVREMNLGAERWERSGFALLRIAPPRLLCPPRRWNANDHAVGASLDGSCAPAGQAERVAQRAQLF
jgi:hypothetical protein